MKQVQCANDLSEIHRSLSRNVHVVINTSRDDKTIYMSINTSIYFFNKVFKSRKK